MAASSITLRRGHIRSIARATRTDTPADLTLDDVVHMFTAHPWTPEYRKSLRSSLIGFSGWCVNRGLMNINLGEELPAVHPPKAAPRPATETQWDTILNAAAPRELLMARMAGELGMRRGEVAKSRIEDLIRDRGGWSLIVNGKGGHQRVVPVPDELAADMIGWCNAGYLFPNGFGGHLSPPYVGMLISQLLGPATMHQLRHRFASLAYQRTRDLRALQRVLGHASLATTERYVLGAADDERSVVQSVAETRKKTPPS